MDAKRHGSHLRLVAELGRRHELGAEVRLQLDGAQALLPEALLRHVLIVSFGHLGPQEPLGLHCCHRVETGGGDRHSMDPWASHRRERALAYLPAPLRTVTLSRLMQCLLESATP